MNKHRIGLGKDFYTDFEWSNNPEALSLYVYLLLRASSKNNVVFGENVERGQILVQRSTLMKDVGIKEDYKFNTAIERLKKSGYVNVDKVRRYYLITLPRYDEFAIQESNLQQ